MSAAPASPSPTYGDSPNGGRTIARWSDGRTVEIAPGRARAYPGLAGEAPDTRAFYAAACAAFEGARRVLDAGCGAGHGARLLAERFDEVIAVDRDERAVEFAGAYATRARVVRGDAAEVAGTATGTGDGVDAATVIDVLGHVEEPRAFLRGVRRRLAAGAPIVVAEARAHPGQMLRAPARRAFSAGALAALLASAGFEVEERLGDGGPFVGYVARAVDDPACDALDDAARAIATGDAKSAVAALQRAEESARRPVRVEALVALGDVRFACGDGDGAARAYLAGRVVGPDDPRPSVGLARLSLAVGERDDARSLALAARALDPTYVAALCALALTEDADDEVRAILRAASALAPDDAELAMAYAERVGAAPAAIHALERARRYERPLPPRFHVLLSELLLGVGRRADAAHEARLARAAAPGSADVAALERAIGRG